MPIGGDVDGDYVVPGLWLDVPERRKRPEDAGIPDQHVEPAIALGERRTETRDAVVILEVERYQRCRTAGRADRVVELLESAHRARDCDHMRARARKRERRRIADPARSAGDQGDAVGEGGGCHAGPYRLSTPRMI